MAQQCAQFSDALIFFRFPYVYKFHVMLGKSNKNFSFMKRNNRLLGKTSQPFIYNRVGSALSYLLLLPFTVLLYTTCQTASSPFLVLYVSVLVVHTEPASSFRGCKILSLWPFIRTQHENGTHSER